MISQLNGANWFPNNLVGMNEYLLFKKNEKATFVLGPKGFNNNSDYPLNKLTLWKLYNEKVNIYCLSKRKILLTYFAESPELVEILIDNGVKVREIRILNTQVPKGDGISFVESGGLTLRTGDSLAISCRAELNNETIFSGMLMRGSDRTGAQKIKIILNDLFHSSYELVAQESIEKDDNPPAWAKAAISKQVKSQRGDALGKVMLVVFIILILISLMWSFLN